MCNTVVLNTLSLLLLILLSISGRNIHAIGCIYMNEQHNDGDRWTVRSGFIVECHVFPNGSWRVDVVACQTPKGIEMHDGDEIIEDDMKFQCIQLLSGGYRIQKHIIRSIACEGHDLGEWWISKKNFNKTCTSTGTNIVNCLTDTGIPIKLNTSVVLNGTRYTCAAHNNGTVILRRDFPKNFRIIPATEQNYCIVNGIQKKIGETWIEDTNFIKKCSEQATIVVKACVDDDFIIDLNSKLTRNGKTYSCTGSGDRNVLFKIIPITDNSTLSRFLIFCFLLVILYF